MGCWDEMWQGDSGLCLGRPVTITTQETIAKVLAASLLKGVQSFILSQAVSSLGPKAPWIWSEMNSAQLVRGERQLSILWQFVTTDETLVHHFRTDMKSELWKGSLLYKKAKTVMSAGKMAVLYFIGCKRSTAVGLLKKGHTFTRAAIDKKSALQPEYCSGTPTSLVSKHGYLVYSSSLSTILNEEKKWCGPLLQGPGWCFLHWRYTYASCQWSKCVHEGGDCVVIVLFPKTNTKCSWSMFQEE